MAVSLRRMSSTVQRRRSRSTAERPDLKQINRKISLPSYHAPPTGINSPKAAKDTRSNDVTEEDMSCERINTRQMSERDSVICDTEEFRRTASSSSGERRDIAEPITTPQSAAATILSTKRCTRNTASLLLLEVRSRLQPVHVMLSEHDIVIQLAVALPVILVALYILVVEGSSITQ